MSNITNTVQFLKNNENRFITIINQETGKKIGKDAVFLDDIPNEDLEAYIKNQLGPITVPTLVWVEMRTKNGASSKKDNVCKIEVSPVNYQQPQEQSQAVSNVRAIIPAYQPQAHSFLGAPANNNPFGLGIADVMGMQRKADLLEDKKEQLLELKEDHKSLKQKYELLEIDHRGTLTKLSIAEAQKDIAVMMAKAENKSVFDSPAFQTLMDKAPELLSGIVALKGGVVPAVAGALGSPDMTEIQREFLQFVAENLNDNQVVFLGSICHFINNEVFINQIKNLIKQNGAV